VLVLALSLLAPFPFLRTVSSAARIIYEASRDITGLHALMLLRESRAQESPQRREAERIRLYSHATREVSFNEAIISATVIDPNVASAEVLAGRSVLITGRSTGETVLIISGQHSRIVYAIEVRPAPIARRQSEINRRLESSDTYSGSYSIYYSPGFGDAPSLLRHSFEFSQRMAGEKRLRASGDLFNFFGRGDRASAVGFGTSFGANRVTLGIDSHSGTLDLLDSELDISRLSFAGYTLRGLHLNSTRASRWRGLELFAGTARRSLTLFDRGEGRMAGAALPLAEGQTWRVRAGAFFISQHRTSVVHESGAVMQIDARYFAPNEKTKAEAEAAYSNGALSWRARLDLRRGAFTFYGETSRLDRRSPFISIGAQSGGRVASAFNLQWRPNARFNASVSYNRFKTVPLSISRRIELNSSTLIASANYNLSRNAHLGFSFTEQHLETPVALPFLLNQRTRTGVIRYAQRLGAHLANEFEAGFISSREEQSGEQVNHGANLREQLHYSRRPLSASFFFDYRSNTPSLVGLLLRNPTLLPDPLRASFLADPARFLLTNRDTLAQLLSGVALPLTRNTDAGIRLQTSVSRAINLSGEIQYNVGEIIARHERNLLTTFSASVRLDSANSIQVSGARSFALAGGSSQTVLTFSFTHRFGAESGGGFQFSRLFGLDRARIEGRVFIDTNGNGRDDTGEPGIAGMKVQLDRGHIATTDARGNFSFVSLTPGEFDVSLVSENLGRTWRASSMTTQHVYASHHQTVNISFGLMNSGFLTGRIFNDLYLSGEQTAGEAPGVSGIRVTLRTLSATINSPIFTQTVDARGFYEFRNLPPGKYTLEIDQASLPPDFELPAQTAWPIEIQPLQGFFLDIPLEAQRAISGIVFIDRDGDGQYNPQRDELVPGAHVTAGGREALTNSQGAFLLRKLPCGRLEVNAQLFTGRKSSTVVVEMGAEPALRTGVNLAVRE